MKTLTKDEQEQLKELEVTFAQHIKIKKYKQQSVLLFAIVTIVSVFFNIKYSLDINLKLFMIIILFSIFSAMVIVFNGIAFKAGLIKGDNWLMRILSDFRLFKFVILLASICLGLAFGATIKGYWTSGFHAIDVAYIIMCGGLVLMCIYILC